MYRNAGGAAQLPAALRDGNLRLARKSRCRLNVTPSVTTPSGSALDC